MNALTVPGLEELDRASARAIDGGNPVALGVAIAGAFGAGVRWGYHVLGPYVMSL
jgi:hypothetical protein